MIQRCISFIFFSSPLTWFALDIGTFIAYTVVGKRKFDGGHQNPGDPKRRYASGLILGNGSNTWGSQPLPQQPLGANGEQWYTDTYAAWS